MNIVSNSGRSYESKKARQRSRNMDEDLNSFYQPSSGYSPGGSLVPRRIPPKNESFDRSPVKDFRQRTVRLLTQSKTMIIDPKPNPNSFWYRGGYILRRNRDRR